MIHEISRGEQLSSSQALLYRYISEVNFEEWVLWEEPMKQLLQHTIQTIMEGEIESELTHTEAPNRRNGHTRKRIRTKMGEMEIRIPRDRQRRYHPRIIQRYCKTLDGLEEKLLALYVCDPNRKTLYDEVARIYGTDSHPELTDSVTQILLPQIAAWQNHPLQSHYPIGMLCTIRRDSEDSDHEAWTLVAVTSQKQLNVLGIWKKSQSFRQIFRQLRARGLEQIPLICLKYSSSPEDFELFSKELGKNYPETQTQLCLVHSFQVSGYIVECPLWPVLA